MILEGLRHIERIGKKWVANIDDFQEKKTNQSIVINHKNQAISFIVKEEADLAELVEVTKILLERANDIERNRNRSIAITHLEDALFRMRGI